MGKNIKNWGKLVGKLALVVQECGVLGGMNKDESRDWWVNPPANSERRGGKIGERV